MQTLQSQNFFRCIKIKVIKNLFLGLCISKVKNFFKNFLELRKHYFINLQILGHSVCTKMQIKIFYDSYLIK